MDQLKFPIGTFVPIPNPTDEQRLSYINQIPGISAQLKEIVTGLSEEQLHTPYRPGGWSVQQVIHHMADNDMNAYIRLKRALTEDEPQASSYREDLWAELDDYKHVSVACSVQLLEALHERFYTLARSLTTEDFNRKFHTMVLGQITVDIALQRFVWHDRHHTAQIRSVLLR